MKLNFKRNKAPRNVKRAEMKVVTPAKAVATKIKVDKKKKGRR